MAYKTTYFPEKVSRIVLSNNDKYLEYETRKPAQASQGKVANITLIDLEKCNNSRSIIVFLLLAVGYVLIRIKTELSS